jgi:hypothetical protein
MPKGSEIEMENKIIKIGNRNLIKLGKLPDVYEFKNAIIDSIETRHGLEFLILYEDNIILLNEYTNLGQEMLNYKSCFKEHFVDLIIKAERDESGFRTFGIVKVVDVGIRDKIEIEKEVEYIKVKYGPSLSFS